MLVISCSNVAPTGPRSQSLIVCQEIASRVRTVLGQDARVVDLRDFALTPCTMCESCAPLIVDAAATATAPACIRDGDFSRLASLVRGEETIVFVVPHYAAIPSKLLILFEKLEEQGYLAHCQGARLPSLWRKAYLVVHGGMTEGFAELYRANLIVPLTNMVKAMGIRVMNEAEGEQLFFGVKEYFKDRDVASVCFRKRDDEEAREEVIGRLVAAIASAAAAAP